MRRDRRSRAVSGAPLPLKHRPIDLNRTGGIIRFSRFSRDSRTSNENFSSSCCVGRKNNRSIRNMQNWIKSSNLG